MQNAQRILSTLIKLPFVIKIFVLSIIEWPLKTGFTVYRNLSNLQGGFCIQTKWQSELKTYQKQAGAKTYLSQCVRFPTMWYVRPAKAQISLRIRAVWSKPLQVTWIFYDCSSTYQTSFWVIKLNSELHRFVWVYTCQNATLLEITCRGWICFFMISGPPCPWYGRNGRPRRTLICS